MGLSTLVLRRVLRSRVLPAPRFRYTPAIQAGGFVFVSGLIGLDPVSEKLVHSDPFAQTLQILTNLQLLCAEQAWSVEQLVLARIYCAGDDVAGKVNQAWDAFFVGKEVPARSFVVVKELPLGAAVEIEFQLLA